MQNVEKHVIKRGHEWFNYCNEITQYSKNLYNTVQFTQRQGFFYRWGVQSQVKLDTLFKQDVNYKAKERKSSATCFKTECGFLASIL